jgi:flagellar hook-length control protein FliK
MLTDLRSLTLDVQEIPAVVDSGADSFAGMFHQQFPEVANESGQITEFKEFFENIPLQADTSEVTLEASRASLWQEPPMPNPNAIAPASAVSLDHADSLLAGPLKPVSELTAAAPLKPDAGEFLPVGGNQLPPARPIGTVDSSMLESAVKTPVTVAVTPPASRPADVAAMQNQPPPEILTRSVAVQPGATIPDQVNPAITPLNADPVVLQEKVAPAESILAVARAMPRGIKPATDSGLPRETGLMRDLAAAAEVSLPRPEVAPRSVQQSPVAPVIAGREFTPDEAPEITTRSVNTAKEAATQVILPAGEAAADRTILRRDNVLSSEPIAAREIIGNSENRAHELPAQTTANASQQPVSSVTGSAPAALVPGAGNVAPASQQNPLPPQLESMSLTRNADSSEWSNGLSERVNWMINQKQNTATIRLDPPALGKLDVQIKIVDDATMITIQTQTAQTRDLIDSASVRLRDFLQESGYQNVNVDVSQRQDQQQTRSQTTANTNPDQDDNSGQEQAADHQRQQQQASYFSGDGLVDTFA